MATKAELEQEVEQLKAQLSSGQPPDVATMTAELDKLRLDLDAVSDERDQAAADLAKSQAEVEELKKMSDQDSQMELELQQQLDSVKQDLQVAKDALAAKDATGPAPEGNHVSVDGTTYDILWRSTVKDLVYEGYHKRHVDENCTAIVIQKAGG